MSDARLSAGSNCKDAQRPNSNWLQFQRLELLWYALYLLFCQLLWCTAVSLCYASCHVLCWAAAANWLLLCLNHLFSKPMDSAGSARLAKRAGRLVCPEEDTLAHIPSWQLHRLAPAHTCTPPGSGTDGDGSGSMKDRSRTNGHGHGEVVKVKREPSTSAGTQQRQQPRQNALGPMHSSGQSTRGGDGSGATTTTTTAGGGTKRPHSPDAAAASTDDENSRLADVVLRPHPKGRRTSHTSRQAASYSGAPSPSPAPASPPHHKHPTPASLPFDAVHLDGSQPVPLGRSSAPLNSSSSSYSHRVRARSSSAQSQSHAHPVHQREGTPIAGAHRLARSQQQQQQQEQTVQLMGLHQGPNTSAGAGWVGDSSRSSSDHCHATSFHNSQGNSGLGAAAAHYPAPPGRVESRSRGEHNSRSVPQTGVLCMCLAWRGCNSCEVWVILLHDKVRLGYLLQNMPRTPVLVGHVCSWHALQRQPLTHNWYSFLRGVVYLSRRGVCDASLEHRY
eukprot:scaffold99743_cov17-Tisochrysis_lutea.AAC.1